MYSTRPQLKGLSPRDRVWFSFAIVALLVTALYILGRMQAQDLADEQDTYCSLVADGAYPDYKGTFKTSCPNHTAKE